MKIKKSIRKRIVIGFASLALLVALIFSLFNFLLIYVIEDSFIDGILKEEATRIEQAYNQNQVFPKLSRDYFQLFTDFESLPREIKKILKEEPERIEVPGEQGRHYHLYRSTSEPKFILVAEVSEILVVRPIREAIIIVLAIFSALMMLLSVFLGYWLANQTIRPLSALSQLVGDSTPESLPKAFSRQFQEDEVGVLARALESAISEIQDYIEREKNFSRDASHELRTPITAILGASEILLESNLSEKDRGVVSRINRAAKQMAMTVNSLLTLARAEISNEEKTVIKVLPIVERIVIDNANLLEGKPVEVELEILESQSLECDEGVLSILLSNLVANAFQYTSAGIVKIVCKDNQIEISDSGSGIDGEIVDTVTENLVKGKNSKGFGIGLSIVKRICEYQKLKLEIVTDANGTRVKIRF